jgi:hypothetical protein
MLGGLQSIKTVSARRCRLTNVGGKLFNTGIEHLHLDENM